MIIIAKLKGGSIINLNVQSSARISAAAVDRPMVLVLRRHIPAARDDDLPSITPAFPNSQLNLC